jgi:hypothetical protein
MALCIDKQYNANKIDTTGLEAAVNHHNKSTGSLT